MCHVTNIILNQRNDCLFDIDRNRIQSNMSGGKKKNIMWIEEEAPVAAVIATDFSVRRAELSYPLRTNTRDQLINTTKWRHRGRASRRK